jgi:hypothetical protein
MLVYEKEKLSLNKVSKITGIIILIMAISAGFSFGVVHNRLFIEGNPITTMNNITQSISLFSAEIFGWLITVLCDIVASWGLYVYFKQVDKSLSLLGGCLRLFYTATLVIAISNLIYILILFSETSEIDSLTIEQLQLQLLLFIGAFNKIWSFGLIFFGLHLFIIGYLLLKSNFVPKLLAILLFIASLSYIMIHFLYLFFPQYDAAIILLEKILSIPMTIGELSLGIWLLAKGGNIPNAAS